MDETLEQLRHQLAERGIGLELLRRESATTQATTAFVELTRGASSQIYTLLYGPKVPLSLLVKVPPDQHPLIYTSYVTPQRAEVMRRAGVQYLDTAGNTWLEFGEVLIEISTRAKPAPQRGTTHTSGYLFTPSRAKIIFALLTWPRLWDEPQRRIAECARTSLGQVHQTLAQLRELGYDPGQESPARASLLDLWAAAYPSGLGARIGVAGYHSDQLGPLRVSDSDGAVFISGESAVDDLLRPASLTLYLDDLDPMLPVRNRWRSDGTPNVIVRHTFWRSPDDSGTRADAVQRAPWPLIYADLLASDDPRVQAAAMTVRERHARRD